MTSDLSKTSPAQSLLRIRTWEPGQEPVSGYCLQRCIGRGGMGEVWGAVGPGGVPVALKRIGMNTSAGVVELAALEQIKGIRHGHLISLFGFWIRDDNLIMAMELADRSVLERLREAQAQGSRGLSKRETIAFLSDAARGVDHLNERCQIQHRDIKPANLLLVGDTVKVADFGLLKVLEQSIATVSSLAMTPQYAAPELWDDKIASQTDQYALAITYYQLRCGQAPFQGSFLQLSQLHSHEQPNLSQLDEQERSIIARALAKRPEERWPNCRELMGALSQAEKPDPHAAPTLPKVPAALVREDKNATVLVASVMSPKIPKWAWIAGCASTVCLALVFAVWWLKPESSEQAKPPKPQMAQPKGAVLAGLKSFTNAKGIAFARIPAGSFNMGSPGSEPRRNDAEESPQHRVTISKDFFLAVHEVSVGQFKAFVDETGHKTLGELEGSWSHKNDVFQIVKGLSWRDPNFPQTEARPVSCVSFLDAVAFCQWLGSVDGLTYRLPTEAEWEYACRAGSTTAYYFGDDPEDMARHGNIADGTARKRFPYYTWAIKAQDGYAHTSPVGNFTPNDFGLYDMHGNLWEWCWDGKRRYSAIPQTDPIGPTEATSPRVFRGGGHNSDACFARSADRSYEREPEYRCGYVGFRVCLPTEQ